MAHRLPFAGGTSKTFRGSRKRIDRIRLRDHIIWRMIGLAVLLLTLLLAAIPFISSRMSHAD